MKKFKLMLIDDQYDERREAYKNIFSSEYFELLPVKSYAYLQEIAQNTPVDGYIVDAFLDTKDWSDIGTAAVLFSKDLKSPPRLAPVFLLSDKWGNPEAAKILTEVNQQKNIDVVRYLAFEEFTKTFKDQENRKDRELVDAVIVLRKKIIDDLSKWHELSLYNLKKAQPIRILLLADLQYTDPHTDKSAIFDEILIGRALNKEGLMPDFIVLAGDISFTGAPNEFRLAKGKIESLAQFMWNNNLDEVRERIIVVPGNHDVNLRIAACDKYKWDRDKEKWMPNSTDSQQKATDSPDEIIYSSHMDFALEPFRQFARRITGSRMWDDAQCLCKVDRRFEHLGIRFFLFNSVASLSIDEPKKANFNEGALEKIFKDLGVDDNSDSLYNMAISHHGILSADTKQIQMENWITAGKQFFKEHKIRLWMFGHYHKHSARTIDEEPFEKEKLGIIQAATLKIRSDSERGFSLIELERKGGLVTTVNDYFFNLNENGCELKTPEPKILFTAPETNSPVEKNCTSA